MKTNHKTLTAYQKGFDLAIRIFSQTKSFPAEEKFMLVNQIRRSSRSVCANIAEAYRKRRYIKDYSSKLSISDAELSETQVWLDFCQGCGYITDEEYDTLYSLSEERGRLIGHMLQNPSRYGVISPKT